MSEKMDQNDALVSEMLEVFLDFDSDSALEAVKRLKEKGMPNVEIAEVFRSVLERIGVMFDEKELFLTELVMAGEILKIVMEELSLQNPKENLDIDGSEPEKNPQIVIGTVQGDIHDIGKNIVASILVANGYSVVNLGVDLSPQEIVQSVKKYNPQILALSSLLTTAYDSMKNTVEAVENAGFRKNLKIVIGGGAVDENVCEYVGADAHGESATDAIKIARKWLDSAQSNLSEDSQKIKTRG